MLPPRAEACQRTAGWPPRLKEWLMCVVMLVASNVSRSTDVRVEGPVQKNALFQGTSKAGEARPESPELVGYIN